MNTSSVQKLDQSTANAFTKLSSQRTWLLLVLVALVAIGVRVPNLDADPPAWYIPHDVGLQIDEGYKTLDARNRILFGDTHWNANDGYPGWSKGSPFTQQSYYLAFKAWGLELASARLVSVMVFSGFLVMLVAVVSRYLSAGAALLAATMLAVDPALFSFSRVALFEIDLILFTYTGLFLLTLVKPHQHVLAIAILAVAGLTAALAVKMSGLVYVAPACAMIALAFAFDERFARFRTRRSLVIVGLLSLAGLLVLFLARGIWMRRVAGGVSEIIAHPQVVLWNNIAELSPLLITTAYLCLIHTILADSQILRRNLFRMALVATVVLVPILLNLFGYNPPRYSVPIVPAAILVIVDWFYRQQTSKQTLRSWAALTRLERYTIIVLVVMIVQSLLSVVNSYLVVALLLGENAGLSKDAMLWAYPVLALIVLGLIYRNRNYLRGDQLKACIVASFFGYLTMSMVITGTKFAAPSFDSQTVRSNLERYVPGGKSVAGDWAPFLAAESDIPALYVNWAVNRAEGIERIRPDYFLVSDIGNDRMSLEIIGANPRVTVGKPIPLGNYYRADIKLYPLTYLAN